MSSQCGFVHQGPPSPGEDLKKKWTLCHMTDLQIFGKDKGWERGNIGAVWMERGALELCGRRGGHWCSVEVEGGHWYPVEGEVATGTLWRWGALMLCGWRGGTGPPSLREDLKKKWTLCHMINLKIFGKDKGIRGGRGATLVQGVGGEERH